MIEELEIAYLSLINDRAFVESIDWSLINDNQMCEIQSCSVATSETKNLIREHFEDFNTKGK